MEVKIHIYYNSYLYKMKQYDSFLIYGCHFSENIYELIKKNTSIKYFNTKINNLYKCTIHELNIPIYTDNNIHTEIKKYFLGINIEQSDVSIIEYDKIKEIDKSGYYKILEMFDISKIDPYLISIPIVRNI